MNNMQAVELRLHTTHEREIQERYENLSQTDPSSDGLHPSSDGLQPTGDSSVAFIFQVPVLLHYHQPLGFAATPDSPGILGQACRWDGIGGG